MLRNLYNKTKEKLPKLFSTGLFAAGIGHFFLAFAIHGQQVNGKRYILQYILKNAPSWATEGLRYVFKTVPNEFIATAVAAIGVGLMFLSKKCYELVNPPRTASPAAAVRLNEFNPTHENALQLAAVVFALGQNIPQAPAVVNTDPVNNAFSQSISTIESMDFDISKLLKHSAVLNEIFLHVTSSKKISDDKLNQILSNWDENERDEMKEMLDWFNEWSSSHVQDTSAANIFRNVEPDYRALVIRSALTQVVAIKAAEEVKRLQTPQTNVISTGDRNNGFAANELRRRNSETKSTELTH